MFINYRNSKTFDRHALFLNVSEKKLKRRDKYVALSNINICFKLKNIKSHTKTINLKHQLQSSEFELSD